MNTLASRSRIAILLLVAGVFGVSLALLCLLNLSSFYELPDDSRTRYFAIVSIAFALIALASIRFLFLPLKRDLTGGRTVLLVALLSAGLLRLLFYASGNLWSIPQIHRLQACFFSTNAAETLTILDLHDLATGQRFAPSALGHGDYPIRLNAGSCATGSLVALTRDLDNYEWNGLAGVFQAFGTDGRIQVVLNTKSEVVGIDSHEPIPGPETLNFRNGADKGTTWSNPWGKLWMVIAKWAALTLSSVFLACLLLALSARISSGQAAPATARQPKRPDQRPRRGVEGHHVLLVLTIAYFILFAFIMTQHVGQPDQATHAYYSLRFAETWGIPAEDESGYHIAGRPFLYWWINGLVVRALGWLMPHQTPELQGLRFLSVITSTFTVLYLYKLASAVTRNKYAGVLAAFVLSNTLMFVFMSGGITYDNLMNLSSIAAIYHLVNVYRGQDYARNTALCGTWLSIGALAKLQGLLLALIVFLLWAAYSLRARSSLRLKLDRAVLPWVAAFGLASLTVLTFYASNIAHYRRLSPACQLVKPAELCTRWAERAQFQRSVDLRLIWGERNKVVDFALSAWPQAMIEGTWGIVSHQTYVAPWIMGAYGGLLAWAVVCGALHFQREDNPSTVLLVVLLGYLVYIFQMNLTSELRSGWQHFAIQGRYLFPVLPALITLAITHFLRIRPLPLRRITLSLTMLLSFAGGLGLFIFKYSEVFVLWQR